MRKIMNTTVILNFTDGKDVHYVDVMVSFIGPKMLVFTTLTPALPHRDLKTSEFLSIAGQRIVEFQYWGFF